MKLWDEHQRIKAFLSLAASTPDQEFPKLENYLDRELIVQALILQNIFKVRKVKTHNYLKKLPVIHPLRKSGFSI